MYDQRHSNSYVFRIGGLVLKKDFKRKKRKGGKLDPKWVGPYTIVGNLGSGLYHLQEVTNPSNFISRVNGTHLTHRNMPGKEPMIQHEFAARPWAKVGADLCDDAGRILLVVCDYYSNYIEVEHLHGATTITVTRSLRNMFSRYEVPYRTTDHNLHPMSLPSSQEIGSLGTSLLHPTLLNQMVRQRMQ